MAIFEDWSKETDFVFFYISRSIFQGRNACWMKFVSNVKQSVKGTVLSVSHYSIL